MNPHANQWHWLCQPKKRCQAFSSPTETAAAEKDARHLVVATICKKRCQAFNFNIKLQFTMDADLQNVTPTGTDVSPK